MTEQKACKVCRLLITHGDVCPSCGSKELTTKWRSYAIILNVDKSAIAKKLGARLNSTYAINIKG